MIWSEYHKWGEGDWLYVVKKKKDLDSSFNYVDINTNKTDIYICKETIIQSRSKTKRNKFLMILERMKNVN